MWLDNNSFFMVYNPNNFDPETPPDSAYFLITRKDGDFGAQKFSIEPCGPWGMNRSPPHQFIARLRNWDNLKDTLIVASTCSGDVGLIANSIVPLSGSAPDGANAYCVLQLDDTRRAQLPFGEMGDMPGDTSPIGMAVDLSSTELVRRPIPKEDEVEATKTPLPAIMVLNNEGVLSAWWYIYNESIVKNIPYHGLIAAASAAPTSNPATTPVQAQPTFGSSGFGAFGSPASASPAPGLAKASPWASNQSGGGMAQAGGAAFGQPSFGQPSTPSTIKPVFGAPSGLGGGTKPFGGALGSQSSPWGQAAASKDPAKPVAFSSFAGANSSFGAVAGDKTEKSLFGGQKQNNDILGSKPSAFGLGGAPQAGWGFGQQTPKAKSAGLTQDPSFGSTMTIGSSLGKTPSLFNTPSLSNNTSDGIRQPTEKPAPTNQDMNMDKPDSVFGQGMGGLSLGGFNTSKANKEPKIKQEPSPERAPLPPDPSTSKATQPEEAPLPPDFAPSKVAIPEEAPLPPDPKPSNSTKPEDAPLPPDPAALPPAPETITQADKSEESGSIFKTPPKPGDGPRTTDSAQLPLSPSERSQSLSPTARSPTPTIDLRTASKDRPNQELHSPVGSEPVDLGASGENPPSPTRSVLPEDDDTERNMRNVTWPRSKVSMPNWTPTPKSPQQKPMPEEPSTPSMFSPDKPGFPSFDRPFHAQPPVLFQPPAGAQSPRSPSPIRDQQLPHSRPRPTSRRSGHSPLRSQALSPNRSSSTPSAAFVAPPRPDDIRTSFPSANRNTRDLQRSRGSIRSPDEELIDEESEGEELRTQEKLTAPLEPTRELGQFIAHQDYVGRITSRGLASQIERVYRDVDSMVDTVGFNARTLGSFMKAHTELDKDGDRTPDDLSPEHWDEWVLVELQRLANVVSNLTKRLADERPHHVRETMQECRDIHGSIAQSHSMQSDIAQQLKALRLAKKDSSPDDSSADSADEVDKPPKLRRSSSIAPASRQRTRLSHAQSTTLTSLRSAYTKTQQQLAAAEDAASLLRAKVASSSAHNRNGNSTRHHVPTVEAATNTIAKMTRMAEAKRDELDLLDMQVRRLVRTRALARAGEEEAFGLGSLSLGASRGSASPRSSTTAATKAKTKKAASSSSTFSVPEASSSEDDEPTTDQTADDSAYESATACHTPPRKRPFHSKPSNAHTNTQATNPNDEDDAEVSTLRSALLAKLKKTRKVKTPLGRAMKLGREERRMWGYEEEKRGRLFETLGEAVVGVWREGRGLVVERREDREGEGNDENGDGDEGQGEGKVMIKTEEVE